MGSASTRYMPGQGSAAMQQLQCTSTGLVRVSWVILVREAGQPCQLLMKVGKPLFAALTDFVEDVPRGVLIESAVQHDIACCAQHRTAGHKRHPVSSSRVGQNLQHLVLCMP